MLEIQNIRMIFDQNTALENIVFDNLSIKIKKGQFVTIIGSNGSGKSTLLKVISGKYFLNQGEIILDGENITHWQQHKRAAYIAQVFQDPLAGTCPELTVAENIALASNRGKKSGFQIAVNKKQKQIFQEKLAILNLGLENRIDEKIGRLSGGQRQAITLLMASFQPAKLWLLDEHTSALDPRIAEKTLLLTKKLIQDRKNTAIMVTHSMRQALAYGNRTIMLDEGKIILDISGKQRENTTPENLIEKFTEITKTKIASDAL